MSRYKPGDVVIGKFPYTNKEEFKIRNFLVIAYVHPFVWGLMMSKVDSISQDDGSAYQLSPNELNFTPQYLTGIRMNVIQTIDTKAIHKTIGQVSDECLERVMQFVKEKLNF